MSQPPSQDSNNPERQRRKKERDRLQEEWNLKHDRLAELRQSLAVETNAAVKFQLRKQIESDEEEIQELQHKLYDLEKFLAGDIGSSVPLTTPESTTQSSNWNQPKLPSMSQPASGCLFKLAIGGFVITVVISSTAALKTYIHDSIFSKQEIEKDYSELKILLRQERWEEADLKTRSIIVAIFSNQQYTDSTKKVKNLSQSDIEKQKRNLKSICKNLNEVDYLWSKHSSQTFGLGIQSQIWSFNNGDYLNFSRQVGWLNNESWQSVPRYKLGYYPRASWWGIMDSSKGAEMVFNKLKSCGI